MGWLWGVGGPPAPSSALTFESAPSLGLSLHPTKTSEAKDILPMHPPSCFFSPSWDLTLPHSSPQSLALALGCCGTQRSAIQLTHFSGHWD